MADNMRWRYGDTNPVVVPIDGSTVVEIGDLLWQATMDKKVRPTELATTADGDQKFLGVAMQRSRAGETDPVRAATTGVFEFDLDAGTYELGDTVRAAGNQKMALSADNAIGRVAKRCGPNATRVLIDIRSAVMGIPV